MSVEAQTLAERVGDEEAAADARQVSAEARGALTCIEGGGSSTECIEPVLPHALGLAERQGEFGPWAEELGAAHTVAVLDRPATGFSRLGAVMAQRDAG